MAQPAKTDISASIGEVSGTPGIQVYINLVTGDNYTVAEKQKVHQQTGEEAKDFNLYVVIPCVSSESATALKDALSTFWNVALAGTAEDVLSQGLKGLVKPEEEEPALVSLHFSTNNSNLVIRVNLSEDKQEQAAAMQEMVQGMAGHIFGHDQSVHFELDLKNSIPTIFSSENFAVKFLEGLKVNLSLLTAANLFTDLTEVAQNMGAGRGPLYILGLATLYQSLTLAFNFRSASDLPDSVRQTVSDLTAGFNPLNFKDQVPAEARGFANLLGEHANGDLHLFLGAGRLVAEVKIHLPGASGLFN